MFYICVYVHTIQKERSRRYVVYIKHSLHIYIFQLCWVYFVYMPLMCTEHMHKGSSAKISALSLKGRLLHPTCSPPTPRPVPRVTGACVVNILLDGSVDILFASTSLIVFPIYSPPPTSYLLTLSFSIYIVFYYSISPIPLNSLLFS